MKILLLVVALSLITFISWRLAGGHSSTAATPHVETKQDQTLPAKTAEAPRSGTASSNMQSTAAASQASSPILTTEGMMQRMHTVLDETSPAKKMLAFAKLLTQARTREDWQALMEGFRQRYNQGKRDSEEWDLFWQELVGQDATMAAELASQFAHDPQWQKAAYAMLAVNWAERDPTSTINWLAKQTHLTDEALNSITLALMQGYSTHDPAKAAAYAMQIMPGGDELWGQTSYMLSSAPLKKGGIEGLRKWFAELPEASRKRLFYVTALQQKSRSLESAVEWLTTMSPQPWRDERSYQEAVQQWAKQDPAAALKWVFSIAPSPKDGFGRPGVGYAGFPWMEQDMSGIINFYQQLPAQQQQQLGTSIRQILTNDSKLKKEHVALGQQFLQSIGQ
jgi:hypothetical protein